MDTTWSRYPLRHQNVFPVRNVDLGNGKLEIVSWSYLISIKQWIGIEEYLTYFGFCQVLGKTITIVNAKTNIIVWNPTPVNHVLGKSQYSFYSDDMIFHLLKG